jgi:ABC-type multidrug transport system fused ATPase/permease subunit
VVRKAGLVYFSARIMTALPQQASAFKQETKKAPFWPILWNYVRPYRASMAVTSICSLLVGAAVALQPLVIKFIVDDGINRPHSAPSEKIRWALIFVGLYILLSYFRIYVWMAGYRILVKVLESFLFTLRSRFFRHVQGLCFRFHDQVSSGELYNYIMGSPIASVRNFLQQFAQNVPYQLVSWIVAFCTLAVFDWRMTLVVLVTVIIIIVVNRRSHRVLKGMSSEFMKTESTVSKYVADMLHGCREIKIHAIENQVSGRFDEQIGKLRFQGQQLLIRQNAEYVKPEGLQYLAMAIIYGAGVYSCIYRDMTIGEFFAFVNSIGLLMGPLMSFLGLNLVKANAEAGLERIMRVLTTDTSLERRPAHLQVSLDEQDQKARSGALPCVEFRNITFAYGQEPVLRNVSCSIHHGQSVALVGPSGSGKSTFVRLVLRLYDAQSGRILVNGADIRDYDVQKLRSNFGVVSQDVFLFQTTIFENIRVVAPHASHSHVEQAMERAFVNEFVRELPHGADTEVGENGHSLSGGQKQRIAIARAILDQPRYFIFDEATSALDNQSERRIQLAMRDLQRDHTMIVIAHRLSTVRHVDKILVLEKGRIVQEGSYDELSTRPGLFETLLKAGE